MSSASDGVFPAAPPWTKARSSVSRGLGENLDDDALMLRVQAGDEAALGQLLERYARLVLGMGYRILRESGEAQELVQDVFLHLYNKRHMFDPKRGTLRAWLIRITCRRALNRREYLNLRRFYDDRNLDDFVEVFQAAPNLEYHADLTRQEQSLRQAFQALSEKQRVTLELYFFEGYTLREVSERLQEPLGNVRHYYYRALDRLKASVELSALRDR